MGRVKVTDGRGGQDNGPVIIDCAAYRDGVRVDTPA